MTNLIEKALLVGFGIFIASIFLSFTLPYLEYIFDYNNSFDDNLNDYLKLINEVDKGVLYIIDNPHSEYQKEIYYPDNLNITIENKDVNFQYYFQGETTIITLKYNCSLNSIRYDNMLPNSYLLIIYIEVSLIQIEIS
jgi:hypothetical protein